MTRLSQSAERVTALLAGADLATDAAVRELLTETTARRSLDLSDLPPAEQAALIAARSQQLQPSADALAARIVSAAEKGRPFVAKFGIDPTGAEVHLGHSVPMQILSRFQRMGHDVVFIVGDMTAKIGDPSGRSDDRPALTDEDIEHNLATYREQVSPFFDFDRAHFRRNGDWLRKITLPEIIGITAQIPVSMSLQREDFRKRLDAGQGLSLAELMYSIVMALDSVEINCDLEVGGIDQFLNMQMCRKVMEISGQVPELVVATSLIEGTDGTGAKMSKSKGNYVPLTAAPGEIFGKIMSVPDRLVEPYFRALSEWLDAELAVAAERVAAGTLHPMDLKKVLAGEVTAAIHGVDAAMKARDEFAARFSRRTFAEVDDLPTVADLGVSVTEAVKALGFAASNGDVRRVAQQNGLRLVVEADGEQEQLSLTADDARAVLADLVKDRLDGKTGDYFLKVGRKLARIRAD
ncbi:tyrosine--tRNA ligase [Pseudonocardia benzenivorans]|uniref:Tyrosine--tRNA ligase n=2 Tax=Pseudonocardia TaxID=1847 RepID=F4CUR1_PSEUX|nr:tyrosine--tRNA ligase [Pseudonocardia dioxanivorans]AEA26375.1 tyrosyl-tRNA synthetase [Pseudonocardia dioxanivorans CB1190]GJF03149.1 tyrosine--tRNA ligase [Pseudonocardia sp. D17]